MVIRHFELTLISVKHVKLGFVMKRNENNENKRFSVMFYTIG